MMKQVYSCPNCSSLINPGSKFCMKCGTALDWQQIQRPPAYQQQRANGYPGMKPRRINKWLMVCLSLLAVAILAGGVVFAIDVASRGTAPALPPTPASTTTHASTPSVSTSTSVQAPPLNVNLHYIGIISAHDQEDPWDSDGEVQLVVAITDGQVDSEPIIIPPTEQGFKIGDFETKEINRRVFHTSSVGDYLKVSIMAYDIDSNTETLNMLSMFEMLGAPGATEFKKLYSLLPQEDDFIGYYEHIWYPEENWGIGQYDAEGHEDLRIWFSIWSDTEPAAIPKPNLLPDVKIKNVSIPSETEQSAWVLNTSHVLTLMNNEDHKITVNWNAYSSVTGNFGSGSATVPGNGHIDIKKMYAYDQKPGPVEIRYTISYRGTELDTWSGTVTVIP